MTSELRPAVSVAEDCHWEYEFKSEEEAAAVIEADREAVRAEQAAELDKLRERLEINPEFPAYDGIVCRDETIRLLDAQVAKWKALAETLAGALGGAVTWNSHDDEGAPAVWLDQAAQALTSYKEQRDAR